ncbi:hypothetical protein [Actinomadura sp. RB99]|uniref:hypothetical protein n=1 Tax=Actinomadura sp. RB99 TaxID=2691577 RepID=UPI001685917A|nr:hypothetical protein [Actinomadura sp. RB99]
MTGRVLIWAGALTAAASAVGLIVYFAVKGFHWVDTVGVIGAVVGIAGLVLAVYGTVLARHTSSPAESADLSPGKRPVRIGDQATNTGIVSTGDGATNTQIKGTASGHGRVYQAGRDLHINDDR